MGDVPSIAATFIGISVIYTSILAYLTFRSKITPRPDLEKEETDEK